MAYPISDVTRRIVYSGSAGVGPYSFGFEVLEQTDVVVYKNQTLLTLTTDYTVTINADGTGSVTLTSAATAADNITLAGDRAIERTTDFVTGGDLFANSLNDELDAQTIFAQQQQDEIDRSIKAPIFDPTDVDMTLPAKATRSGKLLQFDTNGNPDVVSSEDFIAGLGSAIIGANYIVSNATGNGSTTVFTLSSAPGSKNNIQIYIDGVYQNKNGFSLAGYNVTFTEAPPVGADIEFVVGFAIGSSTDASGITYTPAGTGAVTTTVQAKLIQTVSVKDFGAVGDGVTDDTAAIQAAIDYASSVITDESGDVDQVTAAVKFPAGKYRTTSAIQIKNCVQLHGDGSGATWVLVDHAGNGFYTASGSYYANIQVYGMHLESGGSAQDGFVVDGQIRNCYYHDVGCRGFRYSFNVTNSWTVVFDQCYSYDCEHHFYCVTDVGGVHIYHGRYDTATDHGIYVDSGAAELIVHDAAVQFGNKSAVYVKNCYTVELDQCFFEGNCIGSTTDYYVYINRDTVYSLTSAAVRNCVFNNLSDSNRDGLGILYVENIVGFDYVARWARNNVSAVPIVGANVSRVNIEYNGANSRSSALTNIGVGSNANAVVSQVARPYGIYGQDMADTSFAPTTRAALNVGFEDIGVAVGTYNSHPSLQGYGDSNKLYLNPADGSILLGQTGLASMDDGTNEFSGRFKEITQATSSNLTPNATTGLVSVDCSGGSRTITLTNLLGAYGRHLYVVKSDGGSNTLTVTAAAGETINGSASWSSTSAYASVHLIGVGTGWVVV